MGLFSRDQNKAGPGVSKDEPRKKGLRRFWEIVSRDHVDLVKINFIFFVCALPSLALFFLRLFDIFEISLMLSVFAAYPIGGALSAVFFCITKMLRDDPGFLWEDFKRKFRENLRQAGVPGVVAVTFVYTQVFLFWLPVVADWEVAGTPWVIAGLVLFVLFSMVAPYVFLHFAYIRLNTFKIVKNSILLALGNIPRSFMGAVSGLSPWVALFLFFPNTTPLLPLVPVFFFSLSWLMSLMWIWPVFNERLKVEETLANKRSEDAN